MIIYNSCIYAYGKNYFIIFSTITDIMVYDYI